MDVDCVDGRPRDISQVVDSSPLSSSLKTALILSDGSLRLNTWQKMISRSFDSRNSLHLTSLGRRFTSTLQQVIVSVVFYRSFNAAVKWDALPLPFLIRHAQFRLRKFNSWFRSIYFELFTVAFYLTRCSTLRQDCWRASLSINQVEEHLGVSHNMGRYL